MTTTRPEVPFTEMHQAVAAYVAEGHNDGVYENDHRLTAAMRERLRVDFRSPGPAGALGHYDSRAQDRFYRQVKTALDKLAEAGVLRKAGAGTTGPDGRPVDRTSVRYYTPEAWDAAVTRAERTRAAESALEDSWRQVGARLGGLGFPVPLRPSPPLLGTDEWERLLDLAELGTELPTAVRFAHPYAGYEAAQQMAARHLEPGKAYPLANLEVGQSSSYVELANLPRDLHFSSVLFEPAKDWDE